MTTRPLAEIKARPPGRRLVASATDETKSRLQAAVVTPASRLCATRTAAHEQKSDGETVRLLLAGRGVLPHRLLTIRLSEADLAPVKELERMTRATRSSVLLGPWP